MCWSILHYGSTSANSFWKLYFCKDLEKPKLLTHGLTEPGIMFAVYHSQKLDLFFMTNNRLEPSLSQLICHCHNKEKRENFSVFC